MCEKGEQFYDLVFLKWRWSEQQFDQSKVVQGAWVPRVYRAVQRSSGEKIKAWTTPCKSWNQRKGFMFEMNPKWKKQGWRTWSWKESNIINVDSGPWAQSHNTNAARCQVVSPLSHRDKFWLASTERLHLHIVQHWIVYLSVKLQSHWAWLGPQSSFYKHLSAQYQCSLLGTHVLHIDLKAPVWKIQVKGSIVRNWIENNPRDVFTSFI